MKKKTQLFITILIDIILLFFLLFSYYVKKSIGAVLFNYLIIFFIVFFIILSLLLICILKEKNISFIQVLVLFLMIILYKFNVEDNVAFLFEIPKIEKKIINNDYKNEVINDDQYLIFEWEPGFLDYQTVMVYDKTDNLGNKKNEKIWVSEGKLTILKKAKKNFYLCVLYR